MFYFSFSCRNWLHGNCLLTGVSFSIKILLAKITSLLWISLCNLLNMPSFRIGSISWCCFVVLLFCRCFPVPLFHYIPIITPVFRCSASVPVFRSCSMFRVPVFLVLQCALDKVIYTELFTFKEFFFYCYLDVIR